FDSRYAGWKRRSQPRRVGLDANVPSLESPHDCLSDLPEPNQTDELVLGHLRAHRIWMRAVLAQYHFRSAEIVETDQRQHHRGFRHAFGVLWNLAVAHDDSELSRGALVDAVGAGDRRHHSSQSWHRSHHLPGKRCPETEHHIS